MNAQLDAKESQLDEKARIATKQLRDLDEMCTAQQAEHYEVQMPAILKVWFTIYFFLEKFADTVDVYILVGNVRTSMIYSGHVEMQALEDNEMDRSRLFRQFLLVSAEVSQNCRSSLLESGAHLEALLQNTGRDRYVDIYTYMCAYGLTCWYCIECADVCSFL